MTAMTWLDEAPPAALDAMLAAMGANWDVFRKHVPVGAYLPIGQLDGDCRMCGEAWPCGTVKSALTKTLQEPKPPRVTMTWLDETVARWGEPKIKPPEQDQDGGWSSACGPDGIRLPGIGWRRGWAWFPDGVNHGVSIDRCNLRVCEHGILPGEHWVLRVWSHHGSRLTAIFTEPPTDDDVDSFTSAAWSCCWPLNYDLPLPTDGTWDLSNRGAADGQS
jgi:hypothetical protein